MEDTADVGAVGGGELTGCSIGGSGDEDITPAPVRADENGRGEACAELEGGQQAHLARVQLCDVSLPSLATSSLQLRCAKGPDLPVSG